MPNKPSSDWYRPSIVTWRPTWSKLRTYQARHLIDDAAAADYYEQLLGDGMGETFARGDADERRKILEKVLPAE